MTSARFRGLAAACLLSAAVLPAGAEEFPRLAWGVAVEIEDDFTFASTDPAAELNDLYATVGLAFGLEFAEGTGLYAGLMFEPVLDPLGDRAFEDMGLCIEELFFAHDFGSAAVRFGKFNPAFGLAPGEAFGVYGADFAEDYELTERLGAAIDIPFEALGGEHVLAFR